MQYKFVSEQHEQQYHAVIRMLNVEDERQAFEMKKFEEAYARLPESIKQEKFSWLSRHFRECRVPYERLLAEILSLASPSLIVPNDYTFIE